MVRHHHSFRSRALAVASTALFVLAAGTTAPWRLFAQAPEAAKGVKFAKVTEADLKEWLYYLASDELQGRQIFTEGYGNAAQYIADHLKEWGVKPIGDHGSYFQIVKLKDYKVTRNSTVSINAGGETKSFKHGDHVTFTANSGGKQTVTFTGVEFVGYGQAADLQGRDLKGKFVVRMSNLAGAGGGGGRAGGGGRGGTAALINTNGAKAVVSYVAPPAAPTAADDALAKALAALAAAQTAVQTAQVQARGGGGGQGFGGGGGRGAANTQCTPPDCDIRDVRRVDNIIAPQFTADDAFYDALFAGASMKFADIKARAQKGEPLTPMSIPATVTVNIDNTFDVVGEQLTKNVVGMIEGSDPKLKDTYVMYGAHLDHVGYSRVGTGRVGGVDGCRRRSAVAVAAVEASGKVALRGAPGGARAGGGGAAGAGRAAGAGAAGAAAGGATPPGAPAAGAGAGGGGGRGAGAAPLPPFDQRDFISNGADDDGSGSVTMMAVAKAFATGPKPKRSIVLVWHSGEEAGLYGSEYNADFPVVPLDKVQAQLNMDMVGRDDCNNLEGDYSNSVFIVGADRISTDLHNLIVETNTTMTKPLGLDYELNDAADPEGVYTRSDHYSYAAKGIPIAFFTTGLHPDYHRVTDTAEKITYPKMARIGQLVYQTGFAIANTERVLDRDNKGPRTGFGTKPEVIKK